MELKHDTCYRALLAHDRRFDGVFFTCVTSTGIYCRPVCATHPPRPENCRFVRSAIEAEQAGFRPCLRCRPELAPQVADRQMTLPAQALAAHIDETLLMDETLSSVAPRFGLGERQLRRVFKQAFGVEPKQYVTSRRLLFAKQLLQDTELPITDVAFSAGFNGRGRLTLNMKRSYGFTPERLRRESGPAAQAQQIGLRADYRPPLDWTGLLEFLQQRVTPLERVAGETYYRLVNGQEVMVKNVPAKNYLAIYLPAVLSHQAYAVLRKVRHLFDLDASPAAIADTLGRDAMMARLIQAHPGMRVPGCWDDFEMLLRAVIGQQVSVAGASTIMGRLVERVGITPAAVAGSTPGDIAALGMPRARAETIWRLARLVQAGDLNLEEQSPQAFYDQLVAIPGVGPWTAEYLRMRVLRWPDAFPAGDVGLQKAMSGGGRLTQRQLLARAAEWRPWRSYAAMLLWKSLAHNGG